MSGVDRFTRQGVGASDRAGFWVHASDFSQKMTQAQDREAYLQDQIDKWTALHGEHFKRAEILKLERDALQQRLTAADERVDVLEGLLRRSQDFVAFVHKCVRRNGEYAPLHRQEMDELNRELSEYVEPSFTVCEQCRGEGRVGGPAPDEGGGKNCPACGGTGAIEPVTDAALKPAEGGGDGDGGTLEESPAFVREFCDLSFSDQQELLTGKRPDPMRNY